DWEFGGPLYANRDLYEKWSPLNHVGEWKTPILIVHSQLDYRVDLSEGYHAFTAAKRMGLVAKSLSFPDEGHWVLRPRNRRIWWGTVLDWLEVHLHESPHPYYAAGGTARVPDLHDRAPASGPGGMGFARRVHARIL